MQVTANDDGSPDCELAVADPDMEAQEDAMDEVRTVVPIFQQFRFLTSKVH